MKKFLFGVPIALWLLLGGVFSISFAWATLGGYPREEFLGLTNGVVLFTVVLLVMGGFGVFKPKDKALDAEAGIDKSGQGR